MNHRKMDINSLLTFFESNIYVFLLIIPFLWQVWVLPVGPMFFIMFAGALVGNVYDLAILFFIVLVSSILWDISGYMIGKKFTHVSIFQRFLHRKKVQSVYEKTQEFFQEKWEIAIFFTRFLVTGLWAPINYMLGIQWFHFRKFVYYVILWEILYAWELLILGYIFRDTFEQVLNIFSNFWMIIFLWFLLFQLWKYLFWKKTM